MNLTGPDFEWDESKELLNIAKHGVSFSQAQFAFLDPRRVIAENEKHSFSEKRYFCIGEVEAGILTVRFTWRHQKIRIIGAGYWREGKKLYETSNG
jgi:uncharacterized protein